MTRDEKELLIKDLCMRFPYGVICRLSEPPFGEIIEPLKIGGLRCLIEGKWDVRPYLRPMSSMTEDERIAYLNACDNDDGDALSSPRYSGIDWLLSNHFDFRGLIEKGLAIEVNESNNPYKD